MKTIVFDFDGTIANTLERIVGIYNDIAPRFGCRKVSTSDLDRLRNGRPQDYLHEFGISYWKLPLLLWVIRRKLKKDIAHLSLQVGMQDTLRKISKNEVRLGILTSNSKNNVTTFLRANDLNNIFTFVISHNSLFGKSRPLSRLKKEYKEFTYVGDEIRDIEAAKTAGAVSAAVTWGFQSERILRQFSPDYILNEPKELLKL